MSQVQDPDDIYRVIDEDKENQRAAEVTRLYPKLRALKGLISLQLTMFLTTSLQLPEV